MELHRLTPMKEGYDETLFNTFYQKTKALRNKLAFEVNPKYLGVSHQEILSWFDDKFMFIFNKYYGKLDNNVLLGYIINGLLNFKRRVLINVMENPERTNFYINRIELSDQSHMHIIPLDSEPDNSGMLQKLVWDYFRDHLTEEEFIIFEITINPPSYIAQNLRDLSQHISTPLILRYLGYDDQDYELRKRVNEIRKKITTLTEEAKNHFKDFKYN